MTQKKGMKRKRKGSKINRKETSRESTLQQGEMAWVKGESVSWERPMSRNKKEASVTSVPLPRAGRSLLDWWV